MNHRVTALRTIFAFVCDVLVVFNVAVFSRVENITNAQLMYIDYIAV